ncbi:hypothetical protein G6F61_007211 [Rhizopus arrhizus]|nr:hypothetical protein G6F61_007211 [Rhizopus arrhizus]
MKEVEEGLQHLNIETTIEVDEDFSQAEEEKTSMEEGDVGPQPFTTTVPTIAILTTCYRHYLLNDNPYYQIFNRRTIIQSQQTEFFQEAVSNIFLTTGKRSLTISMEESTETTNKRKRIPHQYSSAEFSG